MSAPKLPRGHADVTCEPLLAHPPPELNRHAGDLLRQLFAVLHLLKRTRRMSEKRSVARQFCALCAQLSAELMVARWASASSWEWFTLLLGIGISVLGSKPKLFGKLLGYGKRLNGILSRARNILQTLKNVPKMIL